MKAADLATGARRVLDGRQAYLLHGPDEEARIVPFFVRDGAVLDVQRGAGAPAELYALRGKPFAELEALASGRGWHLEDVTAEMRREATHLAGLEVE